MLRNGLKTTKRLRLPQRNFTATGGGGPLQAKNNSNASLKQGKIMGKLFGDRLAGSKKRWFPTNDNANPTASVFFKSSQFGRSTGTAIAGGGGGGGKGNTRRMTVLNKLFMKHITDLLATGEASEAILGRGLQVSRVKISPDFAGVNVYWSGSVSDPLAEAQLEQELQSCSGRLRHDLSQLALMGEVPRITFVRDKTYSNLAQLESLMRGLDFGVDGVEEDKEDAQMRHSLVANQLKSEFYGKARKPDAPPPEASLTEEEEAHKELWPEMRHDVLGLDHRDIMSKVLAKMRKTKLAWEQLHQPAEASAVSPPLPLQNSAAPVDRIASLERINQKIAANAEAAQKFDTFLTRRRGEQRKNLTPEHKRFRKTSVDWLSASDAELDAAAAAVLSPQLRSLHYAEDYIDDETEEWERKERENDRKS